MIGFAGIGGIGSNVAVHLARTGLDAFLLVDFDRVEASNLNRQFYFHDQIGLAKTEALTENLRRIRPELRLDVLTRRITPENCQEIFAACSIIVEGLDRREEKKMLLEACADKNLLVSACGIAGSELAGITSRKIGNCVICGDFTSDCRDLPLFSHKVQAVAAYMSEMIIQRYRA